MSDDHKFRDLVQKLQMGVLCCDTKGNITFVNQFLLDILGSPSEKSTRSINLFTFRPLVKTGLSDILTRCINDDTEVTTETAYTSIWGNELFLKITSLPDKDVNDRIVGCIVTFENISRRKNAEDTISKKSNVRRLMSKISAMFMVLAPDEIDNGIIEALGSLGEITHSNLVCIFRTDKQGQIACTHSWHGMYSTAEAVALEDIVSKNSEWFNEKSESFCLFSDTELKNLGIDEGKVNMVSEKGKRSLIIIPMFNRERKMNFMCMNSLYDSDELDDEMFSLLSIICEMFINAILRRDAGQLLLKNEEKYLRIFEEIHDVYFETSLKGDILTISPSVRQHLGYHESEMIGKLSNMFYSDHDSSQEFLNELTKNGDVAHYETKLVKKDGSIVDVSINAHLVYDDNGKPSMIAGVIRDITKTKKANIEIKEQKQLLSSTFSSIPDLLAVIDSDYRVVLSNWKGHEHLKDGDELLNSHCYEIFMHQKSPCNNCIPFQVFETGEITTYSETNKIDNTVREVRVIPVFDIDGNVSRIIEHVRDITEQKRAEKEIITSRMVAEMANRTKSEFIANMSHELRTPLNSIIGFSDFLVEGTFGDLNDKQTKYLSNISSSGKHLLMLINDILDISKIEAGEMKLNFDYFILLHAIEEVISIMNPQALKKNITMKHNVSTPFKMTGDRARIKQVFYNLISNAIKFTPENGVVDISAEIDNNTVTMTVCDTGIGISIENLDKLFHPFKQVDSFYNRQYQGTGLGLALVKKFVEMHNGTVGVESELGKGSCFIVRIPLSPEIPV